MLPVYQRPRQHTRGRPLPDKKAAPRRILPEIVPKFGGAFFAGSVGRVNAIMHILTKKRGDLCI